MNIFGCYGSQIFVSPRGDYCNYNRTPVDFFEIMYLKSIQNTFGDQLIVDL